MMRKLLVRLAMQRWHTGRSTGASKASSVLITTRPAVPWLTPSATGRLDAHQRPLPAPRFARPVGELLYRTAKDSHEHN